MIFGTKAQTLESLRGRLKSADIPDSKIVNYAEWRMSSAQITRDLWRGMGTQSPLIARSSASSEDGADSSGAGRFTSIGQLVTETACQEAIDRVFESYDRLGADEHVFIQPMVAHVDWSGVAFSRDPSTGSPYYVINYDDSDSTNSVTSGNGRETKNFIFFKSAPISPPDKFKNVVSLLKELESIFGTDSIDVEFAVDAGGRLHLLQVRRLAILPNAHLDEENLTVRLHEIHRKLTRAFESKPFLLGSRTIFGVMPDWNPAEIIGIRPRPLALSLYKELVTDSTWAYQRDNYGYRNLRSQPLIQSFHGCPFVDVRVDFNSFIPADVPEPLANKLVESYLDRLSANPRLHDKVEFDIVFSCYHFELQNEMSRLAESGFTPDEISKLLESLRKLTVRIVDKHTGLWKKDLERIAVLEERHKEIMSSSLDVVEKIYWLLEDCKRYGTLPFAGLARAGFIAVQMLKSMVTGGLLPQTEYGEFMNSLNSVSSKMSFDFSSLSKETFLSIYGHLRPGTYDILSPRYDEAPESYFEWDKTTAAPTTHAFRLSLEQYKRIDAELHQHGLDLDVLGLFDFLKSAIEGREYAKFLFTRNVSDALSLMKRLGREHGFSPEDLSFADIGSVQKLYSSSYNAREALARSIEAGRQAHAVTRALFLPGLIFKPDDIYAFHQLDSEPNYITHLRVESDLVLLGTKNAALEDKIVFIENADPGFDWIFTKGIGGFVTMYGGANSHMAIRAAEMKVPAVIGAGEVNYKKWSKAKRLLIDCCNRQVKVLQ